MTGMDGTMTTQTPPAGKGSGSARALPLTRARRIALVIGVPLCLLLTGYIGLSLIADVGQGHFPVNYAFPAGTGKATVSVSGGDVTVRQAAGTEARLTGTATYSLIRPDLKTRHIRGGVVIRYNCMVPAGNCGERVPADYGQDQRNPDGQGHHPPPSQRHVIVHAPSAPR